LVSQLGTQEDLMERLKKIRLTPQQGSAVSLRTLAGLGMMMTMMTATISATFSVASCIRCLVGGMAVEEAEQGSWMVTVGVVGSGVNHQEEELISWIPHLCRRGSHPPVMSRELCIPSGRIRGKWSPGWPRGKGSLLPKNSYYWSSSKKGKQESSFVSGAIESMPQVELMIENSAGASYEDMVLPSNVVFFGHVADLSSHVANVIEIVPHDAFDAHDMVPQITAKEQGSAANTTRSSDKVPQIIAKEKGSAVITILPSILPHNPTLAAIYKALGSQDWSAPVTPPEGQFESGQVKENVVQYEKQVIDQPKDPNAASNSPQQIDEAIQK
jgi:hypothetical protein